MRVSMGMVPFDGQAEPELRLGAKGASAADLARAGAVDSAEVLRQRHTRQR